MLQLLIPHHIHHGRRPASHTQLRCFGITGRRESTITWFLFSLHPSEKGLMDRGPGVDSTIGLGSNIVTGFQGHRKEHGNSLSQGLKCQPEWAWVPDIQKSAGSWRSWGPQCNRKWTIGMASPIGRGGAMRRTLIQQPDYSLPHHRVLSTHHRPDKKLGAQRLQALTFTITL